MFIVFAQFKGSKSFSTSNIEIILLVNRLLASVLSNQYRNNSISNQIFSFCLVKSILQYQKMQNQPYSIFLFYSKSFTIQAKFNEFEPRLKFCNPIPAGQSHNLSLTAWPWQLGILSEGNFQLFGKTLGNGYS